MITATTMNITATRETTTRVATRQVVRLSDGYTPDVCVIGGAGGGAVTTSVRLATHICAEMSGAARREEGWCLTGACIPMMSHNLL